VGSGNLENLPSESGTGEPQLGPKVFDLNAEGVLKILGAQKLLAEVSIGGNLPLSVFHEGAYLLLIGARNVSHGPLDHINVALRSEFHPFEIFKHHGSNGFERVFFSFHVTLAASHLLDTGIVCPSEPRVNGPRILVRVALRFPQIQKS